MSIISVGGAAARSEARTDGPPTGLVSYQTSGTSELPRRLGASEPPDFLIHLDSPKLTRLRRMRCRVLTGARLHCQQKSHWRAAMLTLTYRPDQAWSARHVS